MKTRLTGFFDLQLPVLQAPTAFVASRAMAGAVSRAGGLGLIGGGYGDPVWIEAQLALAGDLPVGCGTRSCGRNFPPGQRCNLMCRGGIADGRGRVAVQAHGAEGVQPSPLLIRDWMGPQ
ncbi:nitronate monooxygenase [Falsihalocynthiibacter arcticus]|uniref:Uncharacterized protein n=1 Tax=Falsihalocynthiibacter arcticus TaxID=1579316 RepID=A0A126V6I1_9RHOB|nr:nitronate monooxygenase [Falsihalocynthiibacter arcticus]AML53309.1 hypothetical protein RC74_20480 [Falsihalocynthiibacter arcticus]